MTLVHEMRSHSYACTKPLPKPICRCRSKIFHPTCIKAARNPSPMVSHPTCTKVIDRTISFVPQCFTKSQQNQPTVIDGKPFVVRWKWKALKLQIQIHFRHSCGTKYVASINN
ncbi:uncharacterized protein LOC114162679 [Vigna unguiculata]|uniref:uncharacterized protein LOC114162679 n=1 Tax=Vigna unguiculata TaxID=3917 RepID=UPI001016D3AB|nr:uncharacterized protein LOC114162679 [Vigna unguiculata]